jgi:hypothetical protein
MLKTLHRIPPLLVTVITLPPALAVNDSKLTENGVRRDRRLSVYKIKTVEFKNFHGSKRLALTQGYCCTQSFGFCIHFALRNFFSRYWSSL